LAVDFYGGKRGEKVLRKIALKKENLRVIFIARSGRGNRFLFSARLEYRLVRNKKWFGKNRIAIQAKPVLVYA